jgi:hypothetical protein
MFLRNAGTYVQEYTSSTQTAISTFLAVRTLYLSLCLPQDERQSSHPREIMSKLSFAYCDTWTPC